MLPTAIRRMIVKRILKRMFFLLFIFCVILAGALTYHWYRTQEKVNYVSMSRASLPEVSLIYGDGFAHLLHGYLDEMDCSTMRGVITPLQERRRVTVSIENYSKKPDQVIYQLRSLDGERLVEDGVMDKWTEADGAMTQELQLANLMENGREYTLILLCKTGDQTVRYYSRVVYMEENHTNELLAFIHSFSDATRSDTPDMIANYIQPNDTMGTDDLSYINIHSKYRMFTWAGLKPVVTGKIETEITDLSGSQITAALRYPISITYGEQTKNYEIEEEFVVRQRGDTFYLLDYDRYMTENFSFSKMAFDNGNIWVGVSSKESSTMLSPDEKTQTFVYQGQLWSYDSEKKAMNLIFTYRDGEDKRAQLDHHSIELVRVYDSGNVDFIVYGYHNRGMREGHVGICFYRYAKEANQIEELFYIPSTHAEDRMQSEMGGLAYVSETNLLYFLYGNTIYSVDLTSNEKMELATQDSADGFYYNESASIVAWHEGTAGQADQIAVMNLENGMLSRIEAADGEFLKIEGFIGDDIIYGAGRIEDRGSRAGSGTVSPLYKLIFSTVKDTIEESGSYESAGMYIIETAIDEDEIKISRAVKNGADYEPAQQDQVFLNDRTEKSDSGIMKSRQNEGFLKECYISMDIAANEVSFHTEQCGYRENPEANILASASDFVQSGYYVYGKGNLVLRTSSLQQAVQGAYASMGCVVDENQKYIWTRGTRDLYKNLTLAQESCEDPGQSMESCLSMFLSYEGASGTDRSRISALKEASMQEITDFLSENTGRQMLNLTGCSVTEILYYINLGHPVLALTEEGSAVLITGYETRAVTLYQPYGAVTSQMTMEEAETYFGSFGYRFISCL